VPALPAVSADNFNHYLCFLVHEYPSSFLSLSNFVEGHFLVHDVPKCFKYLNSILAVIYVNKQFSKPD
jgi:hypothetical protein